MWAAQFYFYDKPNCLVSSGGLGTMGFELPGAIGAKVGRPDATVWCIAGDGGFQMTIQELATMVQENLAIKIAIINNGYLGMVRQWQELFYARSYVHTQLYNPDFVKIAEAYGVPGMRVKDKLDVIPAIEKAMEHQGPFLIDFVVEPEENVFPIVPPGSALVQSIEMPKPETVDPTKGKRGG
jgi:acetolactate synthase-1/2/3 large subunit